MDLEQFREYCISKQYVTEDFPFDETTLVFKVAGKMFALTDIYSLPFSFNLKCNPEKAIEYREHYNCIKPGWHMNKKHWNTITPDLNITDKFIKELIDHSYDLVFKSLTKSQKASIK